MGIVIKGRTFKSGNSSALRLPKELGLPPGTRVTIEKSGRGFAVQPIEDPDEVRRDLETMAAEIKAVWEGAGGPPLGEIRDPDIFPNRPGLY